MSFFRALAKNIRVSREVRPQCMISILSDTAEDESKLIRNIQFK